MGGEINGCRRQLQVIRYSGDRNLEVVTGKVYSSANLHVIRSLPPPQQRTPDPPPYYLRPDYGKVTPGRCGGGGQSAWCFSDPEMKRKKRVASYKAYGVEGKLKAKLRKGFRWIKNKCNVIVHGY